MKHFLFMWSWLISGILVSIVASAFGFNIMQWQWWAVIILGNVLAIMLVNYLRKVK